MGANTYWVGWRVTPAPLTTNDVEDLQELKEHEEAMPRLKQQEKGGNILRKTTKEYLNQSLA